MINAYGDKTYANVLTITTDHHVNGIRLRLYIKFKYY